MFGTIAGFLALTLFAMLIVSAVFVGRKAVQLLHVRGDTEVLKAKITQEELKHRLQVNTHQQNLQLLALTAPKEEEEPAEIVKVKDKDVVHPSVPLTDYWDNQRMQRNAEDAEVEPLPFTG